MSKDIIIDNKILIKKFIEIYLKHVQNHLAY